MHRLTRHLPPRRLVAEQGPSLGASIIIAEFFYKFHSFTFECVAFLATWYVVDALLDVMRQTVRQWRART